MYTVDDKKDDLYDEDEYDYEAWNNRKSLIFKIIIIILCIIVLIWLIKALKGKNNEVIDNGESHAANIEKVRLAAEDYFFIKNNKKTTDYVTVSGLKNAGLIDDVVDANNKVCSSTASRVDLKNEVDDYKMTINLACSTDDDTEVFYYRKKTSTCLNCSGNTHMDGRVVIIDDDAHEDEEKADEKEDEKEEDNTGYSCKVWSAWSKDRVYDSDLTERSKTLVQGVKYGTKKMYTEWSEYSTTPVKATDKIEVETKVVKEKVWGSTKTGTGINPNASNIKVISSETIYNTTSVCSGFMENGNCYSNTVKTGNLTFKEYNSGNYKVRNGLCGGVQTLQNSQGLYVLTYVNCQYNEKISKTNKTTSYVKYTYQEQETKNVTYYRYRTLFTVNEPDQYTEGKYEEKDLPEGYVKVAGSEEVYYSYILNTCEK